MIVLTISYFILFDKSVILELSKKLNISYFRIPTEYFSYGNLARQLRSVPEIISRESLYYIPDNAIAGASLSKILPEADL